MTIENAIATLRDRFGDQLSTAQVIREHHGHDESWHPDALPDAVIFPETTWHAAFGGPPGRSQHAINFMASPVTDEEIANIKALYESWTYSLHPAAELINSDRPRLRAMVERMVELGFGPPAPAVPFE